MTKRVTECLIYPVYEKRKKSQLCTKVTHEPSLSILGFKRFETTIPYIFSIFSLSFQLKSMKGNKQ